MDIQLKRATRLLKAASIALIVVLGGTRAVTHAVASERTSPVDKINAEASTAKVSVQALRGHISVLMGSGGNIGVLTGRDGKLMVDGGIALSRGRLQAGLHQISPAPVKYLINTHWHWDHTDSNAWLHAAGARIIAHENTKKRLVRTTRVEDWSHTFLPVPKGARPTIVVRQEMRLNFDGEPISIKYYGPSHTDGDLSVYFPKADVLMTGDTWWNGYYPFIDYATGGSIDGMIRAANDNVAIATDRTIVVPGHGPVGGRTQLIEYRDMLVAIRANVAKLKRQGKSLDAVIAAKPTATFDAKWGNFVIDPVFFTRLVYRGT